MSRAARLAIVLAAFAAVALGLVWSGGPIGRAEAQAGFSDERYPHLFNRQPNARVIRVPERPQQRRAARAPAEAIRPPRDPATPAITDAPADPAQPAEARPTTFVLVLGDNLAEWLAYGLEEALEDIPELSVVDRSRITSGLVRADYYDWIREAPPIIAAEARVDFIMIMLGSNDRQAIRVDNQTHEVRSDRWRELYAERVDALMAAAKARGVPVYWVGLPALRGARLTADMAYFNDIYKERATRAGVTYIDIWPGFVDEQGQFAQFGPDFAGQVRRLRTNDGVHFTLAGARKLAFFVEQNLRRDLVGRINPAAPLPEGERPPAPGLGIPAPEAAVPNLEASGLAPPRPRPLAGPVFPLAGAPTVQPAAQTGAPAPAPLPASGLAGERPAPSPTGAPARLLGGQTPAPPPGRADDFRWMRPMPGAER